MLLGALLLYILTHLYAGPRHYFTWYLCTVLMQTEKQAATTFVPGKLAFMFFFSDYNFAHILCFLIPLISGTKTSTQRKSLPPRIFSITAQSKLTADFSVSSITNRRVAWMPAGGRLKPEIVSFDETPRSEAYVIKVATNVRFSRSFKAQFCSYRHTFVWCNLFKCSFLRREIQSFLLITKKRRILRQCTACDKNNHRHTMWIRRMSVGIQYSLMQTMLRSVTQFDRYSVSWRKRVVSRQNEETLRIDDMSSETTKSN